MSKNIRKKVQTTKIKDTNKNINKNYVIVAIAIVLLGSVLIITLTKNHSEQPVPTSDNKSSADQLSISNYATQTYQSNNTISDDYSSIDVLGNNNAHSSYTGPVLVTFRIDDVTFATPEKSVLQNAVAFAKKYHITFDLGVISKPFHDNEDPVVYKIYQDNTDVLEIVAHGYTHINPVEPTSTGEFYDRSNNIAVPYDTQEQHISAMRQIFIDKNLPMAQKIFFLPGSGGDNNTIDIAKKYGYEIITQVYNPDDTVEYNDGQFLVTRSWVSIPQQGTLSKADVSTANSDFSALMQRGVVGIEILLHRENFYNADDSDALIKELTALKSKYPNIKFGFLSERLPQ